MARLTLILSIVTAVIALLGGFRWAINEWRLWRIRRRLVIGLCLLGAWGIYTFPAEAAICYVRDGGTAVGASGCDGSGGDWNTANAYDQLSSAEAVAARGDTIYVADGTYTGVTFNVVESGTTPIKVCKATVATVGRCSTAHGTNTGWVDTYGDGTATFTSSMLFESEYWEFDGVRGGGPTDWSCATPCGFTISTTAVSPGIGIGTLGATFAIANFIGSHFEVVGDYNHTGGGNIAQDGVALLPNFSGPPATGTTYISYFYLHDLGRCPFFVGYDNLIVEYGRTGTYEGDDPDNHSEVMSVYETKNSSSHLTWRYNLTTHVSNRSTGGLMIDTQAGGGADVYGNIFFRPAGTTWAGANHAGIGSWDGGGGERYQHIRVYNNTFVDINNAGTTSASGAAAFFSNQAIFDAPANAPTDNIARNNLLVNCSDSGSASAYSTFSHNHYISCTPNLGTDVTTGTGDPFVDKVNFNFHLSAATTAGFDVGAGPTGCTAGVNCYNVDMYGVTRGADGVWDRGAVEFDAGAAAVSGLRSIISVRTMQFMEVASLVAGLGWHFRRAIFSGVLLCVSVSSVGWHWAAVSTTTMIRVPAEKVAVVYLAWAKQREKS